MRNWVHYLKHYRPAHRNWRDSWRRSYWSREQYFGGGSYQTFSGYRLTRRSRGKSSSVGSLRPGYLNCIGLETKQAVSKLKELTACKLLNLVQIGDPDLSFHKITNGGNWLLQDTAGLWHIRMRASCVSKTCQPPLCRNERIWRGEEELDGHWSHGHNITCHAEN